MEDDEHTSKQELARAAYTRINGLVYEAAGNVEAFADCMKRQCSLGYEDAYLDHIEDTETGVRRILRLPNREHLCPINPKELRGYIARTNSRKAPRTQRYLQQGIEFPTFESLGNIL